MNPEETHIAVGELVQAAAHQHGVVGPVPFTVSRPKYYEWCGVDDDSVAAWGRRERVMSDKGRGTKTNVIDEKIKPLCIFPHEKEAYGAICERFGSFENFRVAVRDAMYDYRKQGGTGLDGGVLLDQVMRRMIPPSAIGFAYYHFNR